MITTVHIANVSPGNVLAKSIYDAESKLLLREGVKLDETLIGILGQRKLNYVEIVEECANTLTQCESCHTDVNLQLPISMDCAVTTWVCRCCNAIYFGRSHNPGSSLDPVDVLLEPTRKVTLSKEIDHAFSKSWMPNGNGSERRAFERNVVTIPVTVVPLSKHFRVIGESVQLTSQDLSQGGVCLKTIEKIDAPYLYLELQLTGRRLRKLVEVVRTCEHGKAFEIGCKFISRVDGNSTESTQLCSVADCEKVAYCEVFWQTVCASMGTIYHRLDDRCPYLCRHHVVENEKLARKTPARGKSILYPYTNQNGKEGITVYKPLAKRPERKPVKVNADADTVVF